MSIKCAKYQESLSNSTWGDDSLHCGVKFIFGKKPQVSSENVIVKDIVKQGFWVPDNMLVMIS